MINVCHVLVGIISFLLGRLLERVMRNVRLKNIEILIIIHVWIVMLRVRNVLVQLIMIVLHVMPDFIRSTQKLVSLVNALRRVLLRNSEGMMEVVMLVSIIARNVQDLQRICVCHAKQTFS